LKAWRLEGLLLVLLDHGGWANVRAIRILPRVAERTTLPQEIPALVEFHFDRVEPDLPVVVEVLASVEFLFLVHKLLDVAQHACIGFIRHNLISGLKA
jgi:hypothetical protein